MGKRRGFGFPLTFICVFLVATKYTCLGVGNDTVVCSKQERLALLKFKHSVVDFGMLSSWVGSNCCQWERVHCDNVTGNVQSLQLGGQSADFREGGDYWFLVGNEVNPSLTELRHLRYLDLSGNNFQGSRIPEFIGSLKQLSHLDLSNANFKGIIPHHLGNLSNLKVLDLSKNYELIADDISWTFGMSSLQRLDLSSLNLSRAQTWDMVLHMIPSLKELSLHECQLFGVDLGIFLNFSRILPNIECLDLGFNYFEGPLPALIHNMTSLTFLDLSNFDFSLETSFANLLKMVPSLLELHLSWCGLQQTHLSHRHLNFSTLSHIQHLNLQENALEGIFPHVLTNMSSLTFLDLSWNHLNSSVPTMPKLLELDLSFNEFKEIEHVGIWRLCHLKGLNVLQNYFDVEMIGSPKNASECSQYALEWLDLSWSLNGSIPEPLGRLANLKGLRLLAGGLTGPIPEEIRSLRFLELLDLSENLLTGPIPTFLGRLVSLQEISLSSNMLSGSIPLSIGQLVKLHSLDVSYNSLEGVVTEALFANLSMLKVLHTSSNSRLTFNVSREWIPPFQLITLQLSSCNIGDEFPQWLQNQRKLERLMLSNTTLWGPLPTWLRKMPFIPLLDLSHNKLEGPLTSLPNGGKFDMSVYGFYWGLFLEDNLFNESIPRSLCRRTYLNFLDLSKNRLTGKIPKCLKNLQQLQTMRFSSNGFSGVIPNSIAHNSSQLRWLSLNDNNFIGELPQQLGNLHNLIVLDLSENKFSGEIPKWIGEKLTSLIVLRLHRNNFSGRIPKALCNITDIHILDVAYNKLTGNIPPCLGQLNAMVKSSPKPREYNMYDYDEYVIQTMKGVDLEYTRIWQLVFNMDLSSNKLVGEIPVELMALCMLVGLNLSNNHLSGSIPDSIGNMTNLISLDLSRNELTGMIPPSIASLNFLSHLNMSYNNLSGRIPTGHQLQTLTDPSIYIGNKDLCGPPLPKNCSNHHDPTTTEHKKKYQKTDEPAKVWLFYLDIMSGFAIGFWGVIGVLLFKKQWRQKLFMFVEEIIDNIYITVLVRVSKIKRGREST